MSILILFLEGMADGVKSTLQTGVPNRWSQS
jgi:hypothetical protein